MKQNIFCIMCFAGLLAVPCAGQTTDETMSLALAGTNNFPFVEKHDLDTGNSHGSVRIIADNPVVKAGERVILEVRFVNTGMSRDFFNPYFKPRTGSPAQVALYDGGHNYLCDLQSFYGGSLIGMSWDDFTFIPGGGSYIGFTMPVRPTYYRQPLPPGDYYLQFIYYKAFIALDPPWAETDPDVKAKRERMKDFENHFDRSELFRSNPVKITIAQ